ncbi:MAG TPA: hypothetical protein VER58_06895 [Thermoanaerobaculia bacterium]|nr:hypothetical protein [Thermoanaerobaculia bacterium]
MAAGRQLRQRERPIEGSRRADEAPGEKMTIAPGSGPSTDVPLPVQPQPAPQREG